jgi:hypothetical protein
LGDRVTVVDPWGPEMRPDEGAEEDYST